MRFFLKKVHFSWQSHRSTMRKNPEHSPKHIHPPLYICKQETDNKKTPSTFALIQPGTNNKAQSPPANYTKPSREPTAHPHNLQQQPTQTATIASRTDKKTDTTPNDHRLHRSALPITANHHSNKKEDTTEYLVIFIYNNTT